MDVILEYLAYLKDYVVDVALLGIFCACVIFYFKKSAIRSIFDCIAFICASFVAKTYCWRLSSEIIRYTKILDASDRKDKIVLFSVIVIFAAAAIIFAVILHTMEKIFHLPDTPAHNKFMSIVLGIIIGILLEGELILIIKMIETTGNETLIGFTESSRIMKAFCKMLGLYYPNINELLIGEIVL